MKISHAFVALIGLGAGLLLLGLLGFRFNLSSSLPLGVYRVVAERPMRGSVVQVCLTRDVAEFARRRGYLGPGACPGNVRPLGKLVLAVAGDIVTLTRDEIRVNGVVVPNSSTVPEDGRGRPLPHHEWGDRRLGQHELWLFSPRFNAYDSRHFGPVRQVDVVSVLRPVLWRGRSGGTPIDWRAHLNDSGGPR